MSSPLQEEPPGPHDVPSGAASQPSSNGKTARSLFFAAVVIAVGCVVGVPSKSAWLARVLDEEGRLIDPLSFVGPAVGWLLFLHVISTAIRPRAHRIRTSFVYGRTGGALLFLGLTLQFFGIATLLGTVSQGPFGDASDGSSGMGACTVWVALWLFGAAMLWWTTRAVERSGHVSGPLYAAFVYSALCFLENSYSLPAAPPPFVSEQLAAVVGWIVHPVALWFIAGWIFFRARQAWPVFLLGVPLRGPLDALAFVLVGQLFSTSALHYTGLVPGEWLTWLSLLAPLVTTLGVMLAMARGGRTTEHGHGRRPWAVVAAAVLLSLLATVILLGSFLIHGGVKRLTAPGPLHGEQAFELALEAETSFAPGDLEAMRVRLRALRVNANVQQLGASRIQVEVSNVSGKHDVLTALMPTSLDLHSVDNLFGRGDGRLEALGLERYPEGRFGASAPLVSGQGSCDALFAWAQSHARDSRCLFGVEEQGDNGSGRGCILRCLAPEPALTAEHVLAAAITDTDHGRAVLVEFDDVGRQRFATMTREHAGEPVAIVVRDRVVSAPMVMEEITGGRSQVSFDNLEAAAQHRAVAILVASLAPGGRVKGAWREAAD